MARADAGMAATNIDRTAPGLLKALLLMLGCSLVAVASVHAQPAAEVVGEVAGEVAGEPVGEPVGESAAEADSELGPEELLELELRNVITSWASAWQSQMDDIYLLHYHPDFQPEGFSSFADWEAARRSRINEPDTISISLREFELVSAFEDTAVVRFMLVYSRPGYADQTRKELVLRLRGHIWQITLERNLDVQILPSP